MFYSNTRLFWTGLKTILLFLILSAANLAWATPPLLKVSGNQIVTNTGCATQLKGVDVDGLEFCSSGYGPPSGCGGNTLAVAQEAVGTWKASIIRLPLNQDSWFGCAGVNQANYQALVASIVNYCSSMNVYVILDLHWSGESSTATAPCGAGWGNDNNVAQQYMADQNAVTFWSSVAAAYANNPAVFFDLYNEPFSSNGNDDSTAWNVWAHGGTGNGASFSTPGMQALLNAVRNAGAQNICLIGGLGYASDLGQIQSYPFTNAGNGIVYSAHLYGNTSGGDTASGWDSQVPAALRAASPVFVGEIGPYITCNGDNATYDSNMFNWVNTTPGIVGATAWSLTTSSCPNLLTDWNFDRTSWGNAVFNWLASPYAVCSSGPTPTPVVASTWRVNAGGPQYTDTQGNVWAADENYSGGTAAVTTSTITGALPGTADQTLYQSQRWGNPFTYSFNVPAGNYQVTMKFAETYWTAAGQRIFNVSVNGTQVLTNFDIFATTGGQNRAIDEVFNNIASNGGLITISFGPASVDNAVVQAIQIVPQPGSPTNTPTKTLTPTLTPTFTPTPTVTFTATPLTLSTWRVVAGGPAHTDCNGNVWSADENYTGGTAAVTTSTITGALPCSTDQALYQDQRYGNPFSYSFNVPAGNYQVTLKFAETYWTAAGDREFNVSINGTTVLTNLDIFATAGGQNKALDEVFNNIAPSGGVITINFGPASVNNAMVSAIQIIPEPGTPTPTFTSTASYTPTTPPVCASWVVNGSAVLGTAVTLTTATNSEAGSAWNASLINLTQNFNMTFKAYFGAAGGADGIDFVLQRDSRGTAAIGYPGGDKGYIGSPSVSPSVAFDLETYNSNGTLQMLEDGSATNTCAYATTTCPYIFPSNIANQAEHTYQVVWSASAKTLQLIVDGTTVMAYNRDLVNSVFGVNSQVYYGFTAATGGANNLQYVYEIGCSNATATFTPSLTSTATLTPTNTTLPPTASPTGTATATLTNTVVTSSTSTPTLTLTPTSTSTSTITSMSTASPTGTSTSTVTLTPTLTSTPIPTSTFTPTSTPAGQTTWRVVAGGPAHTDCLGNVWSADENFSGGTAATTTNTITGALPCSSDQALYQNQRYGTFTYTFPVAAGNYQVTLKFAELYWTAAGDREFNVSINGNTVLTNFDIFATADAGNKAVDEVFNNIASTGGTITITFGPAAVNNAMVQAIQIVPQSSVPTATPTYTPAPNNWRVVAGGPAHTDCNGNVWAADENYSGGTAATSTNAITGALPCSTDGALYQDQRYGTFTYTFPEPAGNYQVTLKFAETYWTAAGQREFNVAINGSTVLTNFDIFATTGGMNKAIDEVYNNIALTSTGAITVTFGPAAVNYAMVDSIQVIGQPAGGAAANAVKALTLYSGPTATFTPSNPLEGKSTPTLTPTCTPTLTPTSINVAGGLLQNAVAAPNVSHNGEPIEFQITLGSPAQVQLSVYNLLGGLVYKDTFEGNAGLNSVRWLLRNQANEVISSGLYIYTLQVNNGASQATKMGKLLLFH